MATSIKSCNNCSTLRVKGRLCRGSKNHLCPCKYYTNKRTRGQRLAPLLATAIKENKQRVSNAKAM